MPDLNDMIGRGAGFIAGIARAAQEQIEMFVGALTVSRSATCLIPVTRCNLLPGSAPCCISAMRSERFSSTPS